MTRRKKSTIKKWSERLTFGKLSFGRGRRRSRRLKQYEQAARVAMPRRGSPGSPREWVQQQALTVAALALLALVGYGIFGTSWFYIYDIEVQGTRLLTEEELYNRAGLEALHLFWFNPTRVAKQLEEDPMIERALLSIVPPNRVRVQVQERIPVAVWQAGDESFYVDGEGVLFGLRGDASEMLVVRDLDPPAEGRRTVDPEIVRAARELAQLLPGRRAFDWSSDEGLSFLTEEKWPVVLGDGTRLATKVQALDAFREQIRPERAILLLDLSEPEHPYYRVGEVVTVVP